MDYSHNVKKFRFYMNFRNILKHLEFSQHFLKTFHFGRNHWKISILVIIREKIMSHYPRNVGFSFSKFFLKNLDFSQKFRKNLDFRQIMEKYQFQ